MKTPQAYLKLLYTDVKIEASGESVIVSWSPPFSLEGVPILHYSVYITSQGVSEQRNTTETHISLERPCASTISGRGKCYQKRYIRPLNTWLTLQHKISLTLGAHAQRGLRSCPVSVSVCQSVCYHVFCHRAHEIR